MEVLIIAEIASNWEGSISKAKKLIKECKKAGANAVKFQMWRAHDLYDPSHPNWNQIKKSEITFKKAQELKKYADEQEIEFFCSAFYPEAIDILEKLNVKKYKIASRTCLLKDPFALETLISKSQTKKSVIISMGMGGNKEKIKNIFKNNDTTFCYCISKYPTKFNEIDWKKAIKYDGFSDHTIEITAPILFTTLKKINGSKKIIIEKHVKLLNSKGPDASSSIDIIKFSEMISNIRTISKAKI
jgi:sialic acid synthase SpsE|tara:strand:+ start:621 stop:1352 length:732 start_codon:yes stop_codon:yes gene_type:complete